MNGRELCSMSGQDSILVIRRILVEWLGTAGRALVLDHLLYESDVAGGDWFHVSDDFLQDWLLLSRREVRDARDHLTELRLVEYDRRGIPYRSFYLVDADATAAAFSEWLSTRTVPSGPVRPNGHSGAAKQPPLTDQTADHSIIQGTPRDYEGSPDPNGSPRAGAVGVAPPKNLSDDKLMFLELCSWHGTTPANSGGLRGKFNSWISAWRKDGTRPEHLTEARRLYGQTFKGGKGAAPSKMDIDLHIAQARAGKTVEVAHAATERRARDVDGPYAAFVEH